MINHHHCDARSIPVADGTWQTCVTSPPYYGLRDYDVEGQIGLEATPELYVAELVKVFREVRRCLRPDGTLWMNLGDKYAGSWGNQGRKTERGTQRPVNKPMLTKVHDGRYPSNQSNTGKCPPGMKPKELMGLPWMVALALRSDGWYLRSEIIWEKTNPMPENVGDRPSRCHEHLFLLSKSSDYFYDADAIREQGGGNARTVWKIPVAHREESHTAVMPEALADRCILAGSSEGDMVGDPFGGTGTTGRAAHKRGRNADLVELNPDYIRTQQRLSTDLFSGLPARGLA